MIANAPSQQILGHQYGYQQCNLDLGLLRQVAPQSQFVVDCGLPQALTEEEQVFRHDEDASEVICFLLNGGPKWGFRIRLLNDNRVIVSRIDRGPAEKSGLRVNDEILSVNNVPLGDKPRSLLINDRSTAGQAIGAGSVTDATADLEAGSNDPPGSASFLGGSVELSKLDFAYQLIQHSSGSNKLVLTVKRFLNPAFARASVAASNMVARGSIAPAGDQTKNPNAGHQQGSVRSRSYHSGLPYRCCECYCDNEGK